MPIGRSVRYHKRTFLVVFAARMKSAGFASLNVTRIILPEPTVSGSLSHGHWLCKGATEQQDTAGQLPDLKKAGCKRIYQETMGGGSLDRPELEKCLDRLETGDTLVVWRLDRRGRSIRNLLQIVDRLDKSGINFISLKENFDTSTAAGRLVFHFFAALTQFERELIRERTMAGLSSARARGRMGGRKKLLSPQQVRVVKTMWDSR